VKSHIERKFWKGLRVPAADCARIDGDAREFVDPVERFFLGKIKQLSRDGQIKLKRLPMRSRPQGSLAAAFLSPPP
jgi:hypothetical protein